MMKVILWLAFLFGVGLHFNEFNAVYAQQTQHSGDVDVDVSSADGNTSGSDDSHSGGTTTATATEADNDHQQKQKEDDLPQQSLDQMTNEELEAICTSRGFELVKELDESGNVRPFMREDYMDAAKQCLDVESEM